MENIDITAMFIATEVREHVIAEYYANMLAELQHAAKRFDYFFAKSDTTPFLPTVLIDHLAWRMDHSRVHYLNPKITSDRLNGVLLFLMQKVPVARPLFDKDFLGT